MNDCLKISKELFYENIPILKRLKSLEVSRCPNLFGLIPEIVLFKLPELVHLVGKTSGRFVEEESKKALAFFFFFLLILLLRLAYSSSSFF